MIVREGPASVDARVVDVAVGENPEPAPTTNTYSGASTRLQMNVSGAAASTSDGKTRR
jgi:hypothetical protein